MQLNIFRKKPTAPDTITTLESKLSGLKYLLRDELAVGCLYTPSDSMHYSLVQYVLAPIVVDGDLKHRFVVGITQSRPAEFEVIHDSGYGYVLFKRKDSK